MKTLTILLLLLILRGRYSSDGQPYKTPRQPQGLFSSSPWTDLLHPKEMAEIFRQTNKQNHPFSITVREPEHLPLCLCDRFHVPGTYNLLPQTGFGKAARNA